jgi:antitoxin component of MazEF toxin-antitoxin module
MNKVLRKVYTKTNSKSLIFNIPLDFAKSLDIKRGDYLQVTSKDNKVYIGKHLEANTLYSQRRVYSKKESKSLIFNLPMQYARELNIVCGDYIFIWFENDNIVIQKLDMNGGSENAK